MTAAPAHARSDRPPFIDLPADFVVLGRASAENFPVASRALPAALRGDLMALYGWARLVDQLGDDYPGDRLGALDEVERQLKAALSGEQAPGAHSLVTGVARSVTRLHISPEPLFDLVAANRQDQLVHRYETFADLVGYCRLSADPVGRMVLSMFGFDTPERRAWSDKVCTALQLVEHWQDVAEDAIVGRTYIPQEDLRRFGVSEAELCPPPVDRPVLRTGYSAHIAPASLRSLIAFESTRARQMLEEGEPLVGSLPGRLRFAVAGFVAGGHAALDALGATGFDPFEGPARPKPGRFAAHLVRLVARARKP